jgi:hypothetical protein
MPEYALLKCDYSGLGPRYTVVGYYPDRNSAVATATMMNLEGEGIYTVRPCTASRVVVYW